jgi:3-isopropylmalate/(R)-2-methylmalate dehydratase small subunit
VEKFTELHGIAAPLAVPNINTDVLIRIERLNALPKDQLGPYCFEAWRYDAQGAELPDFVLNKPEYRQASILITGANFGCGSSREAAVWALRNMGYRCIVAPSFGDIFFGNCFQNGVLPVVLPADVVDSLRQEADTAQGQPFTVDLNTRTITTPTGRKINFPIDASRRLSLLQGLDEISMTLGRLEEIAAFQQRDRQRRPWIYDTVDPRPGMKL